MALIALPDEMVVGLAMTVPFAFVLVVPDSDTVPVNWLVPLATATPAPATSTWRVPELEAVPNRAATATSFQVQLSLGATYTVWLVDDAVRLKVTYS